MRICKHPEERKRGKGRHGEKRQRAHGGRGTAAERQKRQAISGADNCGNLDRWAPIAPERNHSADNCDPPDPGQNVEPRICQVARRCHKSDV